MSVQMQNIAYYTALIALIGGLVAGVAFALRARREAREGVDFTSEADMLREFQRARDAGEMDDAEFRRVRDLLINGKGPSRSEDREAAPRQDIEAGPQVDPLPEPPGPTTATPD